MSKAVVPQTTTMPPTTPSDFADMRHVMVASQLRTTAVNDPRVVAAMARVPRERFVPAEARALAYRDTAIPLGGGRWVNLPMATGKLLTEAYLRAEHRVLLIGAARGYTAAVLAELVLEVTAVEQDPGLAALAAEALAGVANVRVVHGPVADGAPDGAPYDVVVIDGAVARVPDTLVDQVRLNGRVVTGLLDRGVTRLAAGTRSAGGFGLADFADVECVLLPGFTTPTGFQF